MDVKILRLNIVRLIKHAKNAAGVLFGIASIILLFINKEDLKIDSVGKGALILTVIVVVSLIYSIICTLAYRRAEVVNGKVYSQYDDLWKIAFPKRSESEKKIVVISVNTTFDTIVDDSVANIDKPLVSPSSMHGQWIKKVNERGVSSQTIDQEIRNSLQIQGIEACRTIDSSIKSRGSTQVYPLGTVASYEMENTIFYLLALSDFDENNNARTSKADLINAIIKLLEYYDKHGNGYNIYIPLIGTGQSRAGVTKEESLKVLTSICRLYVERINGCANIVVYKKDRNEVAL